MFNESRLKVNTGEYYYIPKSYSWIHKGFFTSNVRDCVCGFISSDKGYAFFHFHRKNDPKDLASKITKDFENSTSLKIVLIGGNFVNGFLPWKEKNRQLTFLSDDKMSVLSGLDALNQMNKKINEDGSANTTCEIEATTHKECAILLESKVSKELPLENLYTYAYESLDQELSKNNFQVLGFSGQCKFKVCSIKDFIGYQNLVKIIYTLTEDIKACSREKILHFHCNPGYHVEANFNGTYSAKRTLNHSLFTRNVMGIVPSAIKNMDQFFKNHSSKNGTESWIIGPKIDLKSSI